MKSRFLCFNLLFICLHAVPAYFWFQIEDKAVELFGNAYIDFEVQQNPKALHI